MDLDKNGKLTFPEVMSEFAVINSTLLLKELKKVEKELPKLFKSLDKENSGKMRVDRFADLVNTAYKKVPAG